MAGKPDNDDVTPAKKIAELADAWTEFQEEHAKGEQADQDKLARIQKSLDELEDFKQAEMKRTKDAKAAEEAAKEAEEARQQHLEELGGNVKELQESTARIETALKRPGSDRGGDEEAEQQKDIFTKFLRFGPWNRSDSPKAVRPEELKVLAVGDDTSGGYLAPAEYVREIIKAETEISPARTIVRVRQTANREVQVPKRTAQFAAVWTAEQGSQTETTGLAYGLERLPLHGMTALVDITNEDLEDSVFDLDAELQMEFAEQFAVAEGAAVVSGNGVTRPEGWMTNTSVSSDNSGSSATIADTNGQFDGGIDLFHNLKSAYSRNGTWVLNRVTLGSVRSLKDGNNNYVWQPGLASGIPNTILGAPYVEMPDMPDEAANAFPMAFGDFRRAYILVDRINMSILRDPYTQGTSGTVRFLARRRIGGQVVLAEAIRKLKCSA